MAQICFVVPIYKVPYDLLQNCIDSICHQTYKDIEIILVDDGSPDECGLICDDNAKRDRRISVIHKKNGGLSDARNAGTKACHSNWITYVDGDDWVEKDFAEVFLKRIENQESTADIYIYNGFRNYAKKQIICTPYFEDGKRFTSYEERERLQKECCFVPIKNNGDQLFIGSAWAKVYKTIFLKNNSLYFKIVPYGEDSIFFLDSVELANTIEYVSHAAYHYRDTEGGMVNGYRKNADQEQDIYVEEIFKFAKKYHKTESFIDALYLRVFIAMQRCVSQKFFNKGNNVSLIKRWNECNHFFMKKPYCEVYRHIDMKKLNRNSKLKYILFKTKLYGLVPYTRSIYNLIHNKSEVKTKR